VTSAIETEWKKEVVNRRSLPWEIMKWPTSNMMVVSMPAATDGQTSLCYVSNLKTGAWCKFTGWNVRCISLFAGNGYFGSSVGTVHRMDITGSDDGVPYVCTYVGLPDHVDSPGVTKTINQARSIFKSNVPFISQISASVDYTVEIPSPPSSASDFSEDVWDVGLWDDAVWDAGQATSVSTKWVSVGKTGFSISPQVQITCGITPTPRTELIAFDILYEAGAVMT
jgi:hypothetical protein